MEFRQVQGPGYCHQVHRFLEDFADMGSIVIDPAGGIVDGRRVAPIDPDG